jgi:hypothetical protein
MTGKATLARLGLAPARLASARLTSAATSLAPAKQRLTTAASARVTSASVSLAPARQKLLPAARAAMAKPRVRVAATASVAATAVYHERPLLREAVVWGCQLGDGVKTAAASLVQSAATAVAGRVQNNMSLAVTNVAATAVAFAGAATRGAAGQMSNNHKMSLAQANPAPTATTVSVAPPVRRLQFALPRIARRHRAVAVTV